MGEKCLTTTNINTQNNMKLEQKQQSGNATGKLSVTMPFGGTSEDSRKTSSPTSNKEFELKPAEKRLDDPMYAVEEDSHLEFSIGEGPDDRQLVAEMVVATAVMRRVEGFPLTDLRMELGSGVCNGTGMNISVSSAIMLLIAGYYWENREHIERGRIAVHMKPDGLAGAWEIIEDAYELKHGEGHLTPLVKDNLVAGDLGEWLRIAAIRLRGKDEFITRVGRLLARKGRLSAGQFDFWCRDNDRRLEEEARVMALLANLKDAA